MKLSNIPKNCAEIALGSPFFEDSSDISGIEGKLLRFFSSPTGTALCGGFFKFMAEVFRASETSKDVSDLLNFAGNLLLIYAVATTLANVSNVLGKEKEE